MSLDEPGGSVFWNTNQRVDSAKLNDIGKMAEQSIWDGLATHLFKGIDGFIGIDAGACKGAKGAGDLDWTVEAGVGVVLGSVTDEFAAKFEPFYVDVQQSGTFGAHDGSFGRIDLITLKPSSTDDEQESVKILTGGSLVPQNLFTRRRRAFTLTVYPGTPSGSPAAPATPAGELAVAHFSIPAVSGPIIAVSDQRIRTGAASSGLGFRPWKLAPTNITAKASNKRTVTLQVQDLEGNAVAATTLGAGRRKFEAIVTSADGDSLGSDFEINNTPGGTGNITSVGKRRVIVETDASTGTADIEIEDLTTVYAGNIYLQLTPLAFFDDALAETSGVGYSSICEIDFS